MNYQRIIKDPNSYMDIRSNGILLFSPYTYMIFEYDEKYKQYIPLYFIGRFGKLDYIKDKYIKLFKHFNKRDLHKSVIFELINRFTEILDNELSKNNKRV